MSLTFLALLASAWGQDPWGSSGPAEASPWDSPSAVPAPVEPSPWMAPVASPWMRPLPVALELAPWWEIEEPDPWGTPTSAGDAPPAVASMPSRVSAPGPADADVEGWGDGDDAADWGDSDDAAGWGDGDDASGWGDAEDAAGWGDSEAPAPEDSAAPTPLAWLPDWIRDFAVGGALETRESLWIERLDRQPLASARQSLDAELRYKRGIFRGRVSGHAEVDFAYLPARERWTADTTQTYGSQVLLREAWVSASPGVIELAAGRQTVAWGDGMLLSPLDVVAPKDLREPGLAELEDLRLPVTMVRLGAYPGNHRFELMWVPEFDPGFRSPPQGPYGYAEDLVAQAPDLNPSDVYDGPAFLEDVIDELYGEEFDQMVAELLAEKTYSWNDRRRRFSSRVHQVYGRWRFRGRGFDIGVVAANLLDRQGTIGFPDAQTFIDEPNIQLPLNHYRYSLIGHSGTASVGKLLVRWEQSFDLHKPFNTADFTTQPPQFYVRRGDLMTTMVGVGFAQIPQTQVDIEATTGTWLKQPFSETFLPQDSVTWAARVSWTGKRDRLRLACTGLSFGADARFGALIRGDASYAVRDGLWVTLGGISYQPGRENGPLLGFEEHDQLFVQSRFSF